MMAGRDRFQLWVLNGTLGEHERTTRGQIAAGRQVDGARNFPGELRPGQLLAMDPGGARPGLPGDKTQEPTFGLPALWIKEEQRIDAEIMGYTVVEPVSAPHSTWPPSPHAASIPSSNASPTDSRRQANPPK